MTGIGALALSDSINNLDTKLSSSINNLDTKLSSLTFDHISGIVPTTKGGTGTSNKSNILSNIGYSTSSDFPTNITVPGDYATIQAAISSIPKCLNKTVYIDISAGTYTENLTICGFTGPGSLYIRGETKNLVTINGTIKAYNNTVSLYIQSRTTPAADANTNTTPYLVILGPAITASASVITIDNCSYVSITNARILGVARTTSDVYYTGINVRYGSNVYVSKCNFRRLYYCCRAQNASDLTMNSCSGGTTAGTAVSSSNYQNDYVIRGDRSSVYVYGTIPGSANDDTVPYKAYGAYGGTSSLSVATAFSVS